MSFCEWMTARKKTDGKQTNVAHRYIRQEVMESDVLSEHDIKY